jgi:hypothetical protein
LPQLINKLYTVAAVDEIIGNIQVALTQSGERASCLSNVSLGCVLNAGKQRIRDASTRRHHNEQGRRVPRCDNANDILEC